MKLLNKNRNWLVVLAVTLITVMVAGCSSPAAAEAVGSVKQVTPQTIAERLPEDLANGVILLDVRTPEEWAQDGHIEGATLIPLQELPDRAAQELPKDAEIIVYCRSGNRSAQAASYLVDAGYGDVSDMGGIADWKAAGNEVVYGP